MQHALLSSPTHEGGALNNWKHTRPRCGMTTTPLFSLKMRSYFWGDPFLTRTPSICCEYVRARKFGPEKRGAATRLLPHYHVCGDGKAPSLRKAFGAAQAAINSVRVCERKAPWSKVCVCVCACIRRERKWESERVGSLVAPVEELSLVFCWTARQFVRVHCDNNTSVIPVNNY